MAIFGVCTQSCSLPAHAFFMQSAKRLASKEFLKNPFEGFIKFVPGAPFTYVISMRALYPNPSIIGVCLLAVTLWFSGGLSFWCIPGIILTCAGILWTKGFMYIMLRKGLRRNNYKGPIKYLGAQAILSRVLERNRIVNLTH